MERRDLNVIKMINNNSLLRFGPSLIVLLLYISCGPSSGGGSSSSDTAQTNSSTKSKSGGSDPVTLETIEIPVKFTEESSPLNLVSSPTTFVISLTGCNSGLTGNNSSPTSLTVYTHDTSCLAKLSSFVLQSQTYLPSGTGSVPFTTWLAGDTAKFIGANANDVVTVKVVSQLSSPIVITDSVSYSFTVIKTGTNNSSSITPSSNSVSLSVSGVEAPNFKINSGGASYIDLVQTGPSARAGIFSFNLTCVVSGMTTGANPSYNSFCPSTVANGTIAGGDSGVDVGSSTNFSFKLIADPNGNGTLTLTQAQSAFSAGGDSTVTLSSGILSGSTGFTTGNLTGPTPVASYPKLILILQAKDSNHPTDPTFSSFQYFPMTVTTISP